MFTYHYSDKSTKPNLQQIHTDVGDSTMSDKNIEYCRWDADIEELDIVFTNELSSEDKTELDTNVTNNS